MAEERQPRGQDVDKAEQRYQEALNAKRNGDLAKAMECFRAATELDREYALAFQELGWCIYCTGGDLGQAAAILTKAINLDNSLGDAHLYLGIVLHRLKRLEESEYHFEKAILFTGRPQVARAFFAEEFLWREGRYSEAEEQFRAAIAFDPTCTLAIRDYARMLSALGRDQEAEQRFLEAIRQDEGCGLTQAYYAEFLGFFQEGREAEAEKRFRIALDLAPEEYAVLWRYGEFLADLPGKEAEAEALLRQAVVKTATPGKAYGLLGRLLGALPDRADEACQMFRQALERTADDGEIHLYYGQFLARRGIPAVAELHLRRATELCPRWAYAFFAYAELLSDMPSRAKEAEMYTRMALDIDPKCEEARGLLGQLVSSRKEHDPAP